LTVINLIKTITIVHVPNPGTAWFLWPL
jgi:hypothetical protein